MDLITKSKELRENPEYSGPIWDLERLETMYEMEVEIDRLKAELDLRDKVIEQYDSVSDLRTSGDLIVNIVGNQVGEEERQPELFAHLAGRGK